MATEHNDRPDEKKQDDFEIEDIGLEEATGGLADAAESCGSACNACNASPPLNQGVG
jgi:hypothetical protein